MIKRRKLSGFVIHVGDEISKYDDARYRITLESGAVTIYLRNPPCCVYEGDMDIPLHRYGAGEWQRIESLLEPEEPERIAE